MLQASIIIPHYNDLRRLSRCLAALHPQLTSDVEVVVVDNGSSEKLDNLKYLYPDVLFLIEPRRGAAAARNRGVAETTAPKLIFLDSDCVPDRNWVSVALSIRNKADLIGGTISVFDETPAPKSGAEAFETVFAFDNRTYIMRKGFSVTANLVTSRYVFLATGGFRTGLSEDLEWCHRATANGFSLIHHKDLKVAHPTRSDWTSLHRKWRRLTIESWALQNRSLLSRVTWALRALLMPASILAHIPRVLFTKRLNGANERLIALGTLARLRLCRCRWMLIQSATGVQ